VVRLEEARPGGKLHYKRQAVRDAKAGHNREASEAARAVIPDEAVKKKLSGSSSAS